MGIGWDNQEILNGYSLEIPAGTGSDRSCRCFVRCVMGWFRPVVSPHFAPVVAACGICDGVYESGAACHNTPGICPHYHRIPPQPARAERNGGDLYVHSASCISGADDVLSQLDGRFLEQAKLSVTRKPPLVGCRLCHTLYHRPTSGPNVQQPVGANQHAPALAVASFWRGSDTDDLSLR